MKTYVLILFAFVLLLLGCKAQTMYVPVERKTTEYRDQYRLDSVYYRDTVRITQRGDTVLKDVVRWRERFVRDTVHYTKTDSVPVIVEKRVEVKVNELTKWQNIRMRIGDGLLLLLAAFGISKAIKWYLNIKKL